MNTDQLETANELIRGIEANLSFLKAIISGVSNELTESRSMDRCAVVAADYYGRPVTTIYAGGRPVDYIEPRQLAHYLARQCGYSPERIGRSFKRDRGTILHSCRAIQNRIDTDPKFADAIPALIAKVQAP